MTEQTPTFHVEVIHDIAALHKLQPEWDALWQSAAGKPPESYATCHASLMTLPPGHTLHCTVARNATGELVGVWPTVVRRRLLWRYARQLAPGNGSPNDMLLAPGGDAGIDQHHAERAAVAAEVIEAVESLRRDARAGQRISVPPDGKVLRVDQCKRLHFLERGLQPRSNPQTSMQQRSPLTGLPIMAQSGENVPAGSPVARRVSH